MFVFNMVPCFSISDLDKKVPTPVDGQLIKQSQEKGISIVFYCKYCNFKIIREIFVFMNSI